MEIDSSDDEADLARWEKTLDQHRHEADATERAAQAKKDQDLLHEGMELDVKPSKRKRKRQNSFFQNGGVASASAKASLDSTFPKGMKVAKIKWIPFEGTISYSPKTKSEWHHVIYNDGDEQDMDHSELENYVNAYYEKHPNESRPFRSHPVFFPVNTKLIRQFPEFTAGKVVSTGSNGKINVHFEDDEKLAVTEEEMNKLLLNHKAMMKKMQDEQGDSKEVNKKKKVRLGQNNTLQEEITTATTAADEPQKKKQKLSHQAAAIGDCEKVIHNNAVKIGTNNTTSKERLPPFTIATDKPRNKKQILSQESMIQLDTINKSPTKTVGLIEIFQRDPQIVFTKPVWNSCLSFLTKFKEKYNHCKLSKKKDEFPILVAFAEIVKKERHGTVLSEERMNALNDIGFEWDSPTDGKDNLHVQESTDQDADTIQDDKKLPAKEESNGTNAEVQVVAGSGLMTEETTEIFEQDADVQEEEEDSVSMEEDLTYAVRKSSTRTPSSEKAHDEDDVHKNQKEMCLDRSQEETSRVMPREAFIDDEPRISASITEEKIHASYPIGEESISISKDMDDKKPSESFAVHDKMIEKMHDGCTRADEKLSDSLLKELPTREDKEDSKYVEKLQDDSGAVDEKAEALLEKELPKGKESVAINKVEKSMESCKCDKKDEQISDMEALTLLSTHSQPKAVPIHNAPHIHSTSVSSLNETGKERLSKEVKSASLSQKQQLQQKQMNGATIPVVHTSSSSRRGRHQPSFVGKNITKSTVQCSYPPCQIIEGLSKCKGCNVAFYCSKNCQSFHWPMHSKTCLWNMQHNSLQGSYPLHHQQYQRLHQQQIHSSHTWNMDASNQTPLKRQTNNKGESSQKKSIDDTKDGKISGELDTNGKKMNYPLVVEEASATLFKDTNDKESPTIFNQDKKDEKMSDERDSGDEERENSTMEALSSVENEVFSTLSKDTNDKESPSIFDQDAKDDKMSDEQEDMGDEERENSMSSGEESTISKPIDDEKSPGFPSTIEVGTKVAKDFMIPYRGEVTSVPSIDNEYYHVTYDDGDEEDLNLNEVEMVVKEYLKHHPRSPERKKLKRKRGEKFPIGTKIMKEFSETFVGKITKVCGNRPRFYIQYEDNNDDVITSRKEIEELKLNYDNLEEDDNNRRE